MKVRKGKITGIRHALAERADNSEIVDLLREMVPGYQPMGRELATTGREKH